MEEEKDKLKENGKGIWKAFCKLVWSTIFNSFAIWLAVNLVLDAFKIGYYLTFYQSISVFLFCVIMYRLFVGGKSE